MKIAVCGKGGSGKSTVTTLLAKEMAKRGKRVLVLDCDESNYGLHLQLGMELPDSLTNYLGGKGKIMEYLAGGPQNVPMLFNGGVTMDDIPAAFYSEKDGIRLMTPGKIQQSNEGCACCFAVILCQFLAVLNLREDEVVILDMEAGIEHFGRGSDNTIDTVVMVVDPSYESVRLSKKVADITAGMGKQIQFVLNKVSSESEALLRKEVGSNGPIAAVLPVDETLLAAGLMGQKLTAGNDQAAALADALLK